MQRTSHHPTLDDLLADIANHADADPSVHALDSYPTPHACSATWGPRSCSMPPGFAALIADPIAQLTPDPALDVELATGHAGRPRRAGRHAHHPGHAVLVASAVR